MRMCTGVSVKRIENKSRFTIAEFDYPSWKANAAVLNLSSTGGVLEIYSHSPMKNFTIFQSDVFLPKRERIFQFRLFRINYMKIFNNCMEETIILGSVKRENNVNSRHTFLTQRNLIIMF